LKPQPLSDAEFDRLEEILKRFGDKRAMNLEQLDGFSLPCFAVLMWFSRASTFPRFGVIK
jgi:hypothetical protein